ncbi:hypothetical protein [Gluconobacter cerinus]|uniref:hypothetical protein n=1 Tax=Gluconobacter cerinus TaxID=38307 RepID=UPI001B8CD345|nr:hypothetical protein [Gluconobacter cerinus]MBS1038074.1 hypothetical protein [Gluconobacter cerinus]
MKKEEFKKIWREKTIEVFQKISSVDVISLDFKSFFEKDNEEIFFWKPIFIERKGITKINNQSYSFLDAGLSVSLSALMLIEKNSQGEIKETAKKYIKLYDCIFIKDHIFNAEHFYNLFLEK